MAGQNTKMLNIHMNLFCTVADNRQCQRARLKYRRESLRNGLRAGAHEVVVNGGQTCSLPQIPKLLAEPAGQSGRGQSLSGDVTLIHGTSHIRRGFGRSVVRSAADVRHKVVSLADLLDAGEREFRFVAPEPDPEFHRADKASD